MSLLQRFSEQSAPCRRTIVVWNMMGGNCMAKRSHNEVQESLRELTRIFRPKDPRKFVKDYIRKYRITGGYEDELTVFVERELVKLNSPAS